MHTTRFGCARAHQGGADWYAVLSMIANGPPQFRSYAYLRHVTCLSSSDGDDVLSRKVISCLPSLCPEHITVAEKATLAFDFVMLQQSRRNSSSYSETWRIALGLAPFTLFPVASCVRLLDVYYGSHYEILWSPALRLFSDHYDHITSGRHISACRYIVKMCLAAKPLTNLWVLPLRLFVDLPKASQDSIAASLLYRNGVAPSPAQWAASLRLYHFCRDNGINIVPLDRSEREQHTAGLVGVITASSRSSPEACRQIPEVWATVRTSFGVSPLEPYVATCLHTSLTSPYCAVPSCAWHVLLDVYCREICRSEWMIPSSTMPPSKEVEGMRHLVDGLILACGSKTLWTIAAHVFLDARQRLRTVMSNTAPLEKRSTFTPWTYVNLLQTLREHRQWTYALCVFRILVADVGAQHSFTQRALWPTLECLLRAHKQQTALSILQQHAAEAIHADRHRSATPAFTSVMKYAVARGDWVMALAAYQVVEHVLTDARADAEGIENILYCLSLNIPVPTRWATMLRVLQYTTSRCRPGAHRAAEMVLPYASTPKGSDFRDEEWFGRDSSHGPTSYSDVAAFAARAKFLQFHKLHSP